MHPSVKRALNFMAGAFIALLILFSIALYTVWHESREIEKTNQNKFNRMPGQETVKIIKYDSLTQIKLDTIEARRAKSHRHVDNLYSGELQRVLDSLYNTQ